MAFEVLVAGARALGVALTPEHLAAFAALQAELLEWNARHNLTAITDPAEIERLHFLDSLSCLLAIDRSPPGSAERAPPTGPPRHTGATDTEQTSLASSNRLATKPLHLIDVGAGAGFPGLPLKIVCPELRLTLVESVGKKSAFMAHVVERLGLPGVRVLTTRAETIGQERATRERFDWAVARAVAPLVVLAEYLLPLVRVGGAMLAQKKGDLTVELAAASAAFVRLGGGPAEVIPVDLPGLADGRCLVVVRKVAPTPTGYPRRVGLPAKKPLTG